MSAKTNIEWADHTFNPWWGCQRVGPGCDNCYAETLDKRTGGQHWGAGVQRRRTSARNWNDPIRWNKKADAFFAAHGRRQRVFCVSMGDVFDNWVDSEWQQDLAALIYDTPHLDWLLLTKRIGNARAMLAEMFLEPRKNVWIGATICNQDEADRDIPKLLAVPAAKRFLSIEPLLGPVDLYAHMPRYQNTELQVYEPAFIDWVIVGGESGANARPMHPDWVRSLRDQCQAAGVPILFKQWGEWAPHQTVPGGNEGADIRSGHVRYMQGDGREPDGHFRRGDAAVARVGKKAAGRLLDGRELIGYP